MTELTHLDEFGAARMVDVSAKAATSREATAEAIIVLSAQAYEAIATGETPKGDIFAVARVAGIMAAKKTPDLIPLCHQIPLSKATVTFEAIPERHAWRIIAEMKTTAQTGVEMEALTAAGIAALTIYDMTKAIDRGSVIESIRLIAKSGGKSGKYAALTNKSDAPARIAERARTSPTPLMSKAAFPRPKDDSHEAREAFRAFMIERRMRATQWAKDAGIPVATIYAFLAGRAHALPGDSADRLARAARVRVEDLFALRKKSR